MRVIFMGTPDFALPCLNELLEHPSKYQVVGVITQPDRPKGRGNKVGYTPVKERALEKNIPVYQPEKINQPDFAGQVKALAPDLIVVVAFGQILKPALLEIPPQGCVNVHASLLPKYRGSAPIHWAVMNGEKETGVTTMYMDPGMDTGDIIINKTLPIQENDTTGSLHDRLALAGARLLGETLDLIREKRAPRIPQKNEEASYAPLLKREHELVRWERTCRQVHNQVRGMNPWPGAYTIFNGREVKIWETGIDEEGSTGIPETVLEVAQGKGIKVQCGTGSLWLARIQPQGKRAMEGDAFARGYRVEKGSILGSVRT